MNTNRLISENEKIYKDFFNNYDIIISCPIVVTFVGDISFLSKGNTSNLTQKITLRNYIGYNKNFSNKEIEYIVRDNNKGFIKQDIETKYSINKKLLKKIGLDGKIGFLSEYNSANPPSIIGNILILKLLIDKKLSIEDIEKLDLENSEFKKILDLVLDLDKKLLQKFNFFGANRNNGIYLGASLLSSDSHILSIQDGEEYIFKNIGENYDFNQLDLTLSLISPNLITKNNYNSLFLDEKTEKIKGFIDEFDINSNIKENIDLYNGINNIGNFYSIKLYKDLLRLYGANCSETNFYRDLKIYRETLKSLFNNKKDELNDKFIKKQILELVLDRNFDFYMDYVGVFSSIKFAIFSQKIGYIDEELINTLNRKTAFNLKLDYSSFYDGYERKGLKLEQYRSLGELSILSSEFLHLKYLDGELITNSGDYDFLIKNTKGLTLDLMRRKIYLDGEKLTSKEIHSQNTTIEILEILLLRLGESVSNKELPKSSYSTNKNEMLGKIVLPIVKLIEERKKMKLPFICKGSLSDFYIKLDKNGLKINIIKKLS